MKKIELKNRKKVLSPKEMRDVRGAILKGYDCVNPSDPFGDGLCYGMCGVNGWCYYAFGGRCECHED